MPAGAEGRRCDRYMLARDGNDVMIVSGMMSMPIVEMPVLLTTLQYETGPHRIVMMWCDDHHHHADGSDGKQESVCPSHHFGSKGREKELQQGCKAP